jgi:hypothetical protein
MKTLTERLANAMRVMRKRRAHQQTLGRRINGTKSRRTIKTRTKRTVTGSEQGPGPTINVNTEREAPGGSAAEKEDNNNIT